MKKLLALVMVLGLVSFASAAAVPLYLTVNGQAAPDMIELYPSDTIELDVEAGIGLIGGEFTLTVLGDAGSIDTRALVLSKEYVNVYIPGIYTGKAGWNFAWQIKAGTQPTDKSLTVDGGNFSSATILDETLASGIMFHCDGPQDVEIVLSGILNGQDLGIIDRMIVKQIPEPMTMSLLGAGALALVRRRRA